MNNKAQKEQRLRRREHGVRGERDDVLERLHCFYMCANCGQLEDEALSCAHCGSTDFIDLRNRTDVERLNDVPASQSRLLRVLDGQWAELAAMVVAAGLVISALALGGFFYNQYLFALAIIIVFIALARIIRNQRWQTPELPTLRVLGPRRGRILQHGLHLRGAAKSVGTAIQVLESGAHALAYRLCIYQRSDGRQLQRREILDESFASNLLVDGKLLDGTRLLLNKPRLQTQWHKLFGSLQSFELYLRRRGINTPAAELELLLCVLEENEPVEVMACDNGTLELRSEVAAKHAPAKPGGELALTGRERGDLALSTTKGQLGLL